MNILLISYSRIGDTILATSLINYLIDNNPNSSFTIVTSSISKDIFRDMPQLSNLIVVDKEKNSKHWFKIWNKTKGIKWDLVVDLRSSYLSYFLRVKKRMIFRGNENRHKIQQFKTFLGSNDNIFPKIWADPSNYNHIGRDKKLTNKYLCIAPISNWTGKDWPIDRYSELLNKNFFEGFEIVILGASNDNKINKEVNSLEQSINLKVNNLMNKADMIETYFILKKAALFLGSDSSNMHISVAAQIPTIALFAVSNDKVYGPVGQNNLVIRGDKSYDEIKNEKAMNIRDEKFYIKDITVEKVLNQIKNIIKI
mgnify:CR=1 FL=1|jgi:ADP-heptose:LPS heptosyltransferase